MLKRNVSGLLLTTILLAGCATTTPARNNQADIDALNARVAALEGQLSAKDQELNALKGRMDSDRAAREAAEDSARRAEEALAASRKAKAPVSDLK